MPPTQKTVNVKVTDASLSVSPYRIKIKSSGQEVVWKCTDGTVQILFNKDGTPFNPTTFPGGAGSEIHSGECATTTNRLYHYMILVNRSSSSLPINIDPEVMIDDSGPPPTSSGGGKKKTAKKKPGK